MAPNCVTRSLAEKRVERPGTIPLLGSSTMRTLSIVVSVVVLACLTTVTGGAQRRGPEGYIAEGIPRMPNPPGPAPTRDLSGVWVGPQDEKSDPMPPMTPA